MHPRHDTATGFRLPSVLRSADLQLLNLFVGIHRLRNLTAAGEELGLTQSAVSRSLSRLRAIYGDPLFLRQSRGVLPTPLADELLPPILTALDLLRATTTRADFDPKQTQRLFRVVMSDIGERYFLPRLMRHLAQAAPGLAIQTSQPTLQQLEVGLAQGTVDLVVGFLPKLGLTWHCQALFQEQFVHVARRGHPALTNGLHLDHLRRLPHVLADPPGMPHAATIERAIQGPDGALPLTLRVGSFLIVGPILAESDLVGTLPSRIAQLVAPHLNLSIYVPPLPIPGFDIAMGWGPRQAQDAGISWLRDTWLTLFSPNAGSDRVEQTA
jgi:DNA-binding transcriptional LysR family regulator